MTYTRLILFNSLVIGFGIAIVQILDPHTVFYMIPIIYGFSFLLNKRLRAKPLILGLTVALGWFIAAIIVLFYIKLRTCEVGSEEWFCDVDGIFFFGFIYFGSIQVVLMSLAAFTVKGAKWLVAKSNR